MRYLNFLSTIGLLLVLASYSKSNAETPSTDLKSLMDDPQGTFITIMNSMLPLEGNGFTMMKVSAEGENGVIFPLVGDFPIPENFDGLETDMLNDMFSKIARQQVCSEGAKAFFKSGLYLSLRQPVTKTLSINPSFFFLTFSKIVSILCCLALSIKPQVLITTMLPSSSWTTFLLFDLS